MADDQRAHPRPAARTSILTLTDSHLSRPDLPVVAPNTTPILAAYTALGLHGAGHRRHHEHDRDSMTTNNPTNCPIRPVFVLILNDAVILILSVGQYLPAVAVPPGSPTTT
jgi:hypothetical protein